jgi:RNA polymerase sigma-70 factor (ECF subfamily)
VERGGKLEGGETFRFLWSSYGNPFDYLQSCLAREESALPYAEIAARLNLTEPAVKTGVHRLRARYRETLRAEIAHTVSSPEEVEDEIRQLFSSFGP